MKKTVIFLLLIISIVIISIILFIQNPGKEVNTEKPIEKSGKKEKVSILDASSKEVPTPVSKLQKTMLNLEYKIIDNKKYCIDDRLGLTKDATENDYKFMRTVISNIELNYLWSHAIRALGFMGTNEAARDLLDMLSESDHRFYNNVRDIIHALGFSANKNPEAFDILLKACKSEFWESRSQFLVIPDYSTKRAQITIYCDLAIQSLAMSGKQEAKKYIYEIARQQNKLEQKYRANVGAIITAIAICEIIEEEGFARFKDEIYPLSMNRFLEWEKNNSEWDVWNKGGPLPSLKEKKK